MDAFPVVLELVNVGVGYGLAFLNLIFLCAVSGLYFLVHSFIGGYIQKASQLGSPAAVIL